MNQRLPSGPTTIESGSECAVGVAYSVMTSVVGLIMPILPAPSSVNQRLPSGPTVIPYGSESVEGVGISLIVPVEGSRIPI